MTGISSVAEAPSTRVWSVGDIAAIDGAASARRAASEVAATRVPAIRRLCRPLGRSEPESTRIHSLVGSDPAVLFSAFARAALIDADARYDYPVTVFLCPRCAYRESSSERNVRHQPRGCSRCGFGFAFELLEDYYASPKTALIVCDKEQRILVAGHAAFAVTGYEEGDLIGYHVIERLGLAGFADGDPAARSIE